MLGYNSQDRYAEARRLPGIDMVSQDWFLINSEETDGFTVLEFSRNFTSCDPQDLDITVCSYVAVFIIKVHLSTSNSPPLLVWCGASMRTTPRPLTAALPCTTAILIEVKKAST